MSSGLKRILSPFVDSRHDTRRPLSAAPSRPPLLPSVALAPPFLVLDAIFSSNKISGRANQIFEPRFFCRCRVRARETKSLDFGSMFPVLLLVGTKSLLLPFSISSLFSPWFEIDLASPSHLGKAFSLWCLHGRRLHLSHATEEGWFKETGCKEEGKWHTHTLALL